MPEPITPPPSEPTVVTDPSVENAALKAKIAELEAKYLKPVEDDLRDRTAKRRDAEERDASRTKRLESSLLFNMKSADFLKQNASLLPAKVADIFKQADRETYTDAVEKGDVLKSGVIQEFFALQANVDLLTPGQRASLDEYLKLTKTEKQERAQATYDMVFEPALEMLKRTKRAEALKNGYGGGTDSETAYKNKMHKLSRQHYLGEKS